MAKKQFDSLVWEAMLQELQCAPDSQLATPIAKKITAFLQNGETKSDGCAESSC